MSANQAFSSKFRYEKLDIFTQLVYCIHALESSSLLLSDVVTLIHHYSSMYVCK